MRIGRIIPWLIVLGALLDAGTRLVPLDTFAFRAWDVLVAGKMATGPFAPNRVYANPMSYGDLANSPEQAHRRGYHLEYFSTDAWGFRNPAELSSARPGEVGWVLIGDSFGVGSGVTDRNTLARRLEARLDTRVYNAAAGFPLRPRDLEFTANRVGMRGGVVLLEIMERLGPPGMQEASLPRALSDGPPASKTWRERLDAWKATADVSRLGILAGWASRRLASEASPSTETPLTITAERLSSGDTMLFLPQDVDVACDANRRYRTDYLVWLNDQLARRHTQLLVLLVPNKYTVYGPLVADPAARVPNTTPLTVLENDLRSRQVFVVNATRPLREAAAARIEHHDYLYFMDDTHWNEHGIAVAAQAVADAYRDRTRGAQRVP